MTERQSKFLLEERIKINHTFPDKTLLINCIYCQGFGKQPTRIFVHWDYDQRVRETGKELCPLCQGKGRLHIYPATDTDPWLPCRHCFMYGRETVKTKEEVAGIGELHKVRGACGFCQGMGFTFFSGKSPLVAADPPDLPYTGETTRLG
jgi:hypothetical protein